MDKPKVKPCPWGHEPTFREIDGGTYVNCVEQCIGGADMPLDQWNRRAPPSISDALSVPEIKGLIFWLARVGEGIPGRPDSAGLTVNIRDAVAPFLAAMEGKR